MRIASEIAALWREAGEERPLTEGLIPARDYTALAFQDATLRLWLPDQARQALTEVCDRLGLSLTTYLTEFFATYLFGVHEVMRMREKATGLYAPKVERLGSAMAPDEALVEPDDLALEYDDPVPEMGKNIFALKIFVPTKLKEGLQQRANRAQVPLGRFARAMICAHLFGRDVSPARLVDKQRQTSLAAAPCKTRE